MSQVQENNNVMKKFVIKDTWRILMLAITSLLCIAITALMSYGSYYEKGGFYNISKQEYIAFAGFVIITLFIVRKFQIHSHGFIIDVENDRLEFPGGGLEANDPSGLFNLARFFRINSVPISQIQQVSVHRITELEVENSMMNVLPPIFRDMLCPKHLFLANGEFGTLKLNFFSKGKRDLLYTSIVQVNEMGIPVVHR